MAAVAAGAIMSTVWLGPSSMDASSEPLAKHGVPGDESSASYTGDNADLTPDSYPSEDPCLSCHGLPGMSITLSSGEKLPLTIDPESYAASVHGDKLLCTDCHSDISSYPHPSQPLSSLREYSFAQYELCKRCHFANYTKTLDSVHFQVLSSGDLKAPLCTDCHGAHAISPPAQPRAKISQTCSRCHWSIYRSYIGSVHGQALLGEDNYDVPVCTDCHSSHNIEDPRTAAFRFRSIDLCADCHTDPELMQKYGISTAVLATYLRDFHGQTVALLKRQSEETWSEEPVCTDCHGVHEIQSTTAPASPVMKANLVDTCRKCHPEATENFPGAWLSHYEPSAHKASLVYYVRWFYRILIPFTIAGLAAHILLDLWRIAVNR